MWIRTAYQTIITVIYYIYCWRYKNIKGEKLMLSRNNHQEQFKKYEPKKQRFTIKKLSVGVASVLLGISFANGVSADTTSVSYTHLKLPTTP